MVKHELDITIDRPLPEVFAYLCDFQKSTEWQKSGLAEVKPVTNGPMAVGYQFIGVRYFMGRRMESLLEMTDFQPNKQFAYKSLSGTTPFKQIFQFEATPQGTKVSTMIELETSGLMGLAAPLIASSLKRDMGSDFETLKKQLEMQPAKVVEHNQ
jgi:hypothetical protein